MKTIVFIGFILLCSIAQGQQLDSLTDVKIEEYFKNNPSLVLPIPVQIKKPLSVKYIIISEYNKLRLNLLLYYMNEHPEIELEFYIYDDFEMLNSGVYSGCFICLSADRLFKKLRKKGLDPRRVTKFQNVQLEPTEKRKIELRVTPLH